jgi:hypothetical protein
MPDQKMRELCEKISAEKDSGKLLALTDELIKLLEADEEKIKANIRARIAQKG